MCTTALLLLELLLELLRHYSIVSYWCESFQGRMLVALVQRRPFTPHPPISKPPFLKPILRPFRTKWRILTLFSFALGGQAPSLVFSVFSWRLEADY